MGNPLRILHVVVNMNRGGAETLLMNLYRNMDRSKIQFDFLTCREGVFDQEIIQMGGRVHRIPYISDVGHFQYIKQLNHFFSNHKEYNIVHSHMDKMSGFVLRAAKKAGIPTRISHSHSTNSEGSFFTKCYKWCAGKYINSNATTLFACSHEAAKWLFPKKEKQTLIVKNGIEWERFQFSQNKRVKVRNQLNIKDDYLVVGHVGRFSTPKNHPFLIDIFKELIKARPKSILILVGDGPLLPEVKRKVIENKLEENVRFLGVRSDVEYLLQAMDLFVFPSLYEGLPVTLVEAQGAGLPCIISDTISPEVDLGLKLIEFIPLINKQTWIDNIINFDTQIERNHSVKGLFDKGYDIKGTSKKLEYFYNEVSR